MTQTHTHYTVVGFENIMENKMLDKGVEIIVIDAKDENDAIEKAKTIASRPHYLVTRAQQCNTCYERNLQMDMYMTQLELTQKFLKRS